MHKALVRIRLAASTVAAYLKPEAFEQRERDRQRRQLVDEWETWQNALASWRMREPVLREQLEKLDAADLAAVLPATVSATGALWSTPPAGPARLPDGEYLQVPRQLRDAFPGTAATLEPLDDGIDFMRGVKVLFAMALGAVAVGLWVAEWTNL